MNENSVKDNTSKEQFPIPQKINFGNIDDFINEIDDHTISNLDSFSLIQKDPDLFYNSEDNNNKNTDNKIFSFQDKRASSPKNEIPIQYFETFNNNTTTGNNSLLNSSHNNNANEMKIDYSKFESLKRNPKNNGIKIPANKVSNLDMFLVNNNSKKELVENNESKMSFMNIEESIDHSKDKEVIMITDEHNKSKKNIKKTESIQSLEENNSNNSEHLSHNIFLTKTNNNKDNTVSFLSDEKNYMIQTTYGSRTPIKSKKSKGSYAQMVHNRFTSHKTNQSVDKKGMMNESNTHTRNRNPFLTSFITGKRCYEVSQLTIKKKQKNKPPRKGNNKLSLSQEMKKLNKIPQYTNQQLLKNGSIVDMIENIKEKYQNEEMKYKEKEQDLENEIQILREKIKQFSINETNYQIEIEKLKRKKLNISSVIDDQQTSVTNNTKVSDVSISKLDEFPKDLNSLLLKNSSSAVETKKQININELPPSVKPNIKYKSFLKLFKQFGLNRNLFCEKKDDSEFIDDTEEIDYDIVFAKYPQIKSFIQLISNRLNKECESRLVLEEKTLQIFTNDIKTIDNLEKKLKKYETRNKRKSKLNLNGSTSSIVNNTQNSIKSCDDYI